MLISIANIITREKKMVKMKKTNQPKLNVSIVTWSLLTFK